MSLFRSIRTPWRAAPFAVLGLSFVAFAALRSQSVAGIARPVDGDPSQQAIAQARQQLVPLLGRYPGIAVAVGVADSLVWSEAFGYADVDRKIEASPATRFRAYSAAKPLTGAAVLQLHQTGSLDLDAPVSRYLSGLPAETGALTIRQLAGHLSGIRDYRSGEWLSLSSKPCGTAREAMDAFARDRLAARPGTAYRYSSFNYVVLSAVIEAVSGRTFEVHMREAIHAPAGMRASMYGAGAEADAAVSVFYEPTSSNRTRVARRVDNTCKFGAGGLVTTASDLAWFGNALLAGRLLDPVHLEMAFSPMTTSAGASTGYAFGWGVGTDSSGTRYAGHSGGAIGGRSALVLYPDQRVVVAILANIEHERLTEVALRIGRLFMPPA